jgi:hypothetical protein
MRTPTPQLPEAAVGPEGDVVEMNRTGAACHRRTLIYGV